MLNLYDDIGMFNFWIFDFLRFYDGVGMFIFWIFDFLWIYDGVGENPVARENPMTKNVHSRRGMRPPEGECSLY